MANRSQQSRLVTGTDFANLALAYRRIATMMPVGRSRERMVRMAQAMEARIPVDDGAAPINEA
jgi:hypothetical protein